MKNLGSLDRMIRIIVGLALVGAAVYLQLSTGRNWWIALPGVVFLATAAISTCPLYLPFGLSTLRTSNRKVNK